MRTHTHTHVGNSNNYYYTLTYIIMRIIILYKIYIMSYNSAIILRVRTLEARSNAYRYNKFITHLL